MAKASRVTDMPIAIHTISPPLNKMGTNTSASSISRDSRPKNNVTLLRWPIRSTSMAPGISKMAAVRFEKELINPICPCVAPSERI